VLFVATGQKEKKIKDVVYLVKLARPVEAWQQCTVQAKE
jgi:hypothetical protein